MNYQRNSRGLLIVKEAWMSQALPNCMIVEMPDGAMKFFGVRQVAHPPAPLDSDLRAYKGHHPMHSTTADIDQVSDQRLIVFGLAKEETQPMHIERYAFMAPPNPDQPHCPRCGEPSNIGIDPQGKCSWCGECGYEQ